MSRSREQGRVSQRQSKHPSLPLLKRLADITKQTPRPFPGTPHGPSRPCSPESLSKTKPHHYLQPRQKASNRRELVTSTRPLAGVVRTPRAKSQPCSSPAMQFPGGEIGVRGGGGRGAAGELPHQSCGGCTWPTVKKAGLHHPFALGRLPQLPLSPDRQLPELPTSLCLRNRPLLRFTQTVRAKMGNKRLLTSSLRTGDPSRRRGV